MKVYFISGLGANEKIFQRIQLPEGFEPVYLNWINPLNDETFESYARRLAQQIESGTDFILIGLSLGGMIAVEMNKFLAPKLTILISSAVNKNELSSWTLFLGILGISNLITERMYHTNSFYTDNFLGIKSVEDHALQKEMLSKAPIEFFHWAIPKIVRWQNEFIPERLLRIHGTKDKIIPFKNAEGIIAIKDGTHFMVFNRANEINKILSEELPAAIER
ncbi:MAG TPA: alpha/beta hydrolase [Arachidicoccus sp.]